MRYREAGFHGQWSREERPEGAGGRRTVRVSRQECRWPGRCPKAGCAHAGRDVGERLYARHAVERMTPRGFNFPIGRSLSPNIAEDAIKTGKISTEIVDGVLRTHYQSGTVTVVTEQGGHVIVTVITR